MSEVIHSKVSPTTTNTESVVVQKWKGHGPKTNSLPDFLLHFKRKSQDSAALAGIYGVTEDIVKKVAEIMEKLMELYLDYGFQYMPKSQVWIERKRKQDSMNRKDLARIINSTYQYDKTFDQLIKYITKHGPDSWVKLLKWKFASFFSFYEGQDIPRSPIDNDFEFNNKGFFKPGNLLGGTFHDFLSKMQAKRSLLFETFKNTVLNGMKKGSPRVSDTFLKKVEEDTWRDLTTKKHLIVGVTIEVPDLNNEKYLDENKKSPAKKSFMQNPRANTEQDIHYETLHVQIDEIKIQLRRTMREVFPKKKILKSVKTEVLKPRMPSTSANYNYSRNKGGGIGGYLSEFRGESTDQGVALTPQETRWIKEFEETNVFPEAAVIAGFRPDRYFQTKDGNLYYKTFGRHFNDREDRFDIGVTQCDFISKQSVHYGNLGKSENLSFQKDKEANIESPEQGTTVVINSEDVRSCYQTNYFTLWNKMADLDTDHCARIIVLSEPLKGRPITAEDWELQFLLAAIQKACHGIMRKMRVFQLIGTPLTEDMINDLFKNLGKNRIINSGDYANATNNMYPWASEICIDELIEILTEAWDEDPQFPVSFLSDLKRFLYKSMTKHTFTKEWTEKKPVLNKQGEPVLNKKTGAPRYEKVIHKEQAPQEHGQLMGSIVSFIFLCVINAAVCRFSMEVSDHKIYSLKPHKNLPMANLLINGDDCIFDGWEDRIQKVWESITSIVGLESSVGKTYFSKNMCTVNSQVYRRNLDGSWRHSKYINYGLLYGIKKSSTIDDKNKKIPIWKLGAYSRDLKNSCPPELWSTVKHRFIYFNYDQLKKTGNIPWFLPEWLGGLGIPDDGELSVRDRCYATVIKRDFKKLKPKPISDAKEWYMHDFVNTQLRGLNVQETPHLEVIHNEKVHKLKEQFDKAYSILTVDLIFKKHFIELYREINIACFDEVEAQKKALNHNYKMYNLVKRIYDSQNSITPMEDDEILPEKKQMLIPVVVLSQPINSMVRPKRTPS